jgi:hypothetical protein
MSRWHDESGEVMPSRPLRNGYEIGNYMLLRTGAMDIEIEVAKTTLQKEADRFGATDIRWIIKKNTTVEDPNNPGNAIVVDLVAYKGFVSVPHHLQSGTA